MEYQLSNLPRYVPVTPRSQVANSPVAPGHVLIFSEDGETLTVKKPDGSYAVLSDSAVSGTGELPWRTNDDVCNCYVMPGGKLYDAASGSLIDGGGVWSFTFGSSGIRDGKLYRIVDKSAQLLDAAPGWSHVSDYCAIRNGWLYYIDSGGNVSIADNVGNWTELVPLRESDSMPGSMGIRDGKLFRVSLSDNGITVAPCLGYSDWTALSSGYGIRNGRLYYFSSNSDGSVSAIQSGAYTDWTACSGYSGKLTVSGNGSNTSPIYGLGIRDGTPYLLSGGSSGRITLGDGEKAVACTGHVWGSRDNDYYYNSGFILTAAGNVYEVTARQYEYTSGGVTDRQYVSRSPVAADCTAVAGSFSSRGASSTARRPGYCLKNGKVEPLKGLQWSDSNFRNI